MGGLIKGLGSIVANSPAFEKFIGLLENSDQERENLIRVLTYHRVDWPEAHPHLDPGLVSASPEAFAAQMKYLAANFQVVYAADLTAAIQSQGREALPPRAVLVTFDDAYADFETHAWPILKQYDIPVTLFVPTAFPDQPKRWFWWDRLFHAINTTEKSEANTSLGRLALEKTTQRKQTFQHLKNYIKTLLNQVALEEVEHLCDELGVLPRENCVLGWDSLRALAQEGVTLGAHTRTHPIMNTITFDEMRAEITGSVQDLQRETGLMPNVFAYPSGIHDEEVVKAVEQSGVTLAFTTERGINQVGHTDAFRIRRINVGGRTTLPVLRAQMLSLAANFYSLSGNF